MNSGAAVTIMALFVALAVSPVADGNEPADDRRPPEAQAAGPYRNLTFTPVAVAWRYGTDGTTFGDAPLAGPPQGMKYSKNPPKYPYAWKGEFEIADPTQVGGLWV
ncbi:MAG: hypothetical protein EBZ59_13185, partial [Planctomycetia bacterium]|nr:hypothetical protein [Planctomycetia bacterium]